MPVAPPVYVEATPTLTPSRFGLLSAAELVSWDDPHLHNGVEFQPNPVGEAGFEATDCVNVPADPRDIPDGVPTATTGPVIVYGGFTCRTVGITDTILNQYARARLAAGEVAGVESKVWDQIGAEATILSPTAVGLIDAVGLIEEWFGARYGGTPTIHAARRLGAWAGAKALATREASKLVTTLGSVWSFGHYAGGAPASFEPADPEDPVPALWLIATGQVQVRRSDVTVLGGTMQSALHRTTNTVTAVAHRTYVTSWDDVSAAVPITLT